ncbi:hypothetical protein Tco_1442075 [Tanacetum coccineum]
MLVVFHFWVKFHGVPIKTFNEDGLSAIATKLSTLLMIDSYTSNMCMQSWGRSSYDRAIIELRVDVELKDTIMVALPKLVGEGFYMCTIRVEYEWKSPRQITKGKLTLVDDDGKPFSKVVSMDNANSDSEVKANLHL